MRRISVPTIVDCQREIRALKDELHTARHALIHLMKPEAREILTRMTDEKDLVVRNAVNRALREKGA